jgi:hypothetical protein
MRAALLLVATLAVGFAGAVLRQPTGSGESTSDVTALFSSTQRSEQRIRLFSSARAMLLREDPREDECLAFLIRYMPERDLSLNISIFVDTVTYALRARRMLPWGEKVPWPVFLNDVLPYSVLAEPRDPWRPFFWSFFTQNLTYWTQLQNMSITDAAAWMNNWGWHVDDPPIHFHAGTFDGLNAYSPFQVIARGNSSCTGLSVYLVSALRTMGIPARVAGTPHWNLGPAVCPDGDQSEDCGNHDWVEAWTDGAWSFIDEAGDKKLNTSWFFPGNAKHQVPGQLNHSIFATSWSPAGDIPVADRYDSLAVPFEYFPMVWDWGDKISSAFDVTLRYLSMLQQRRR